MSYWCLPCIVFLLWTKSRPLLATWLSTYPLACPLSRGLPLLAFRGTRLRFLELMFQVASTRIGQPSGDRKATPGPPKDVSQRTAFLYTKEDNQTAYKV